MNILLFFIILLLFTLFDSFYLFSFNKLFKELFFNVQKTNLEINYFYAICVYLLMTLCIYYFGFIKNLKTIDIFLLGFFIYGIYELTNKATLKKWYTIIIPIDTIWGGILFASVFHISKNINKFYLKN